MENTKKSLTQLRVQSFVTTVPSVNKLVVNGGADDTPEFRDAYERYTWAVTWKGAIYCD